MNDWIFNAIKRGAAKENKGGKRVSPNELNEAFDAGRLAAEKARGIILAASGPFRDKERGAMEATLVIFVAVWTNLSWAKAAVDKTNELPGFNPVAKLWEIFEIGMSADGPEAAFAALAKWMQENGKSYS